MAMLNDCNFIGHVGKQPQAQTSQKGERYLRFSLAIDQGRNQKGKEKDPLWLTIVVFGKLAELMAEKLMQGAQVFVKGRLQLSSYTDKDGVERQATAIHAIDIQLLDKRQAEVDTEAPAADT